MLGERVSVLETIYSPHLAAHYPSWLRVEGHRLCMWALRLSAENCTWNHAPPGSNVTNHQMSRWAQVYLFLKIASPQMGWWSRKVQRCDWPLDWAKEGTPEALVKCLLLWREWVEERRLCVYLCKSQLLWLLHIITVFPRHITESFYKLQLDPASKQRSRPLMTDRDKQISQLSQNFFTRSK